MMPAETPTPHAGESVPAAWRLPLAAGGSLVALVMMLPAFGAAAGLLGLEALRVVRPESVLFAPARPTSFAEALRVGEVEVAHAFVRDGADVNNPIAFSDAALTGGRAVTASPLLIAVAARNTSVAQMLVGFGARLDLPQNAGAVCLARALGDEDLARAVAREGGIDPPTCDAPPSDAPPLVSFSRR